MISRIISGGRSMKAFRWVKRTRLGPHPPLSTLYMSTNLIIVILYYQDFRVLCVHLLFHDYKHVLNCIHCKSKTNKNFANFLWSFKNFQKSNFVRGKFLKIQSSINSPCGHARSHTKFGPDRISRFDLIRPQMILDVVVTSRY